MRKLKIMQEDPVPIIDPFGINDLQDRLKTFCREQGLDAPLFWIFPPEGVYIFYGISISLKGKDKWEEHKTNVFYVMKDLSGMEKRDAEENRLRSIFEDISKPIVLTAKIAEFPAGQQQFFKRVGLSKMPVTWSDHHQNEYEVYVKGHQEKGRFVNLIEQIEFIGKEIVFI